MRTKQLLAAGLLSASALAWAQPDVAAMARDLSLAVAVDSNKGAAAGARCVELGADWGSCLKGRLILQNHGSAAVPAKDWTLYLHSIRRLLKLDSPDFELSHLTGDLYRLTPKPGFAGIAAGAKLELPLVAEYWMLHNSDVLPRPYLVTDGQAPAVLARNDDDDASYLLPLPGDEWKSPAGEARPLMDTAERYREFARRGPQLAAADVAARVIPAALRVKPDGGKTAAAGLSWRLPALAPDARAALAQRSRQLGLAGQGLPVSGAVVKGLPADIAVAGGYRLRVGRGGARIDAHDAAGLFYGAQTLLGLMPQGGGEIPTLTVEDAPRYAHRGFMVDVARNFRQPATLKRLIEQMAAYKLNKLHLHLSDDEGWRLQINGLPELTEVGARRCHDLNEDRCLLPQLGSGPDNRSGGGYLSRDQYVELLRYAKARFIEVIPEIDMPAHARAAVMAMERRYRHLSQLEQPEAASAYRLIDPQDRSNTLSVQFYDRHTYVNPCVPGVPRFVDKVVSEVAAMHREAGAPLAVWHFGGDEAKNILLGGGFQDLSGQDPGKGKIKLAEQDKPWARSPACRALLAERPGKTVADLPLQFAEDVSRILARHGIATMGAWQDGLKGAKSPKDFATAKVMVTEWDALFWGAAKEAHEFANKGFETVLAMPDYLYFDFPYELNPKERGYYWASRATDSYKVFSFAPDNLPQNAEVMTDRQGKAFEVPSEAGPARFAGIQGQAWSEVMRSDAQFEYMAYPRLLALAERAWHRAGWERPYRQGERYQLGVSHLVDRAALNRDWQQFAAVLGWREAAKLERAGIGLRIAPPGLASGAAAVLTEFPGQALQFSPDGRDWTPYRPGLGAEAPYWRGVSGDGARFSRQEARGGD